MSGLLGMLILAALNGETSLRGMWIWGREHWEQIQDGLGFSARRGRPQDGTLWNVLSRVSLATLGEAIRVWGEEVGREIAAVSVDGKTLRGSKRRSGLPAVQVMVAVAQGLGVVLDEAVLEGGDAVEAALRLLQGIPIAGKVVSLDAGLNHLLVVEAVLEKGGPVSEC